MRKKTADLYVDPEYLEKLAREQVNASGEVTDARDDISGLVGSLPKDHGRACVALIGAMKSLENVRAEAASNLAKVSVLLAENLTTAAGTYAGADEKISDNIDAQVRDR